MKTPQRPSEEHLVLREFDEDERKLKAAALAELTREAEKFEREKKALQLQAKSKQESMDEVIGRARALADDLSTGKHLVPVQFEWKYSPTEWTLFAIDTGETRRIEATTMADRQGDLAFPAKN